MTNDEPYYRELASRARAEADGAVLDNVRERGLRAVAAFEAMADNAGRIAQRRAAREAKAVDADSAVLIPVAASQAV